MALDSRIILGSNPGAVQRSFNQTLNSIGQFQDLRQQNQQRPLQNELLKLQVQQQQAQAAAQPQILDLKIQQQQAQGRRLSQEDDIRNVATFALQAGPVLESGNLDQFNAMVASSDLLDDEDKHLISQQAAQNPQQALSTLGQSVSTARQRGILGAGQGASQFGSSLTLEDSEGNLFTQTQRRNPSTGAVESVVQPLSGGQDQPVGAVSIVSSTGETATGRIEREKTTAERTAKLQRKTKAVEVAVKKGGDAFDRIEPIQTGIRNYDEAIAAIDEGAETGVIDKILPNIRESSIKLDNVIKRLGLDVVGNTTFGALSESELKFALQAAIPDNLQPEQLKKWLIAKKRSQQKALERVQEAASFLSSGENTLKDWIEFDKANQLNAESDKNQPSQTSQQSPAQGSTQVGRFTVEVVN